MRIVVALALLLVTLPGRAAADSITFDIQAWVDGRSLLILRGDAVQWHNLAWEAPGTWFWHDDPTIISSWVNGTSRMSEVEWYPSWPVGTYGDVWSTTFTGLDPDLPGPEIVGVTLTALRAREALSIYQTPDGSNGYTLILDFNDDLTGEADWYHARVTLVTGESVTPAIPEPGTLVLLSTGLAWCSWRRRRA